jgi:hypothetical protein
VVVTVVVDSTSIICLLLLVSESEYDLGLDSVSLSSPPMIFRATFIDVVPRDFVEVTPLPSVLLHLLVTLLFMCLGLVFLRLNAL